MALLQLLPPAIAVYVGARIFYALYLHPLARAGVPGPWYAAIGDYWSEFSQLTLRYSRDIQSLMDKYGPVIRIAENKVVFLDADAQKAVYGASTKLPRDKYYKRFMTGGADHSMTILDHAAWANRRRASGNHYSTTNLAVFEGDVDKFARQMVDGFNADNGNHSFDLMSVFRHLLVDIVFKTGFDLENGTLEKWSRKEVDPLDLAVTDFPKLTLFVGLFPKPVIALLGCIPVSRIRAFFQSDEILKSAATGAYEAHAEGKMGGTDESERKSLMKRLMGYKQSDIFGGGNMKREEVVGEAQAHLIAGSETTATTASLGIWLASQDPELLARLRVELDEHIHNKIGKWTDLFDATAEGNMPVFNGFVREVLRLYAVIPGPMYRVLTEPVQIGQYNVPEGTTVATQSYTLHRQTDVFPNPLDVNVERWFVPREGSDPQAEGFRSGEGTEKMRANFVPFGVGPRVCVGQNLGQTMIRVIMSTILANFDPVPAAETTPKTMEFWESFALFPKGLQAKFYLKPRKSHL